jgi:glycerol-3-phosphate O-acyltransferase
MELIQLNDHIKRLRREKMNLIILKEDKTLFTSSEEGMKPLIEAINRVGISTLEDAIVVDKIVGKAAALLISYFRAKKVHCIVLSKKGRTVLENHSIKHYEERLTPEIMNRRGTALCPFEQAVMDVDDPQEGYERVSTTLKALGII